jgi:hypothetical protein
MYKREDTNRERGPVDDQNDISGKRRHTSRLRARFKV